MPQRHMKHPSASRAASKQGWLFSAACKRCTCAGHAQVVAHGHDFRPEYLSRP